MRFITLPFETDTLTTSQVRVMVYIAARAQPVAIKVMDMAAEIGMSHNTIRATLREMRELKIISVVAQPSKPVFVSINDPRLWNTENDEEFQEKREEVSTLFSPLFLPPQTPPSISPQNTLLQEEKREPPLRSPKTRRNPISREQTKPAKEPKKRLPKAFRGGAHAPASSILGRSLRDGELPEESVEAKWTAFKKAYPSRGPGANNAVEARRIFYRLVYEVNVDPDIIIEGARLYKLSDAKNVGTRMIAAMPTFLNQARYENYIEDGQDVKSEDDIVESGRKRLLESFG